MLEQLERIVLITGHYGSGKTNLAVNLALDLHRSGRKVVLCDLDIVNPYFRTADFEALMHGEGIETIVPAYANTNLDIPVLGPGLSAALGMEDKTVVVDVGGDDAGAVALGRYAADIAARPYQMLYVYNQRRYLTQEPADALAVLREIGAASRLGCTHIVNNSNLGEETDRAVVESSFGPCGELSRLSGLPVALTCVPRAAAGMFAPSFIPPYGGEVYPVGIYVKKPWDK